MAVVDDPYRQLAHRIRGIAHEAARAHTPATLRFKVRHTGPLMLEEIEGDLVLEEGDEDFDIDERLLPGSHVTCPAGDGVRNQGSLPEVGDIVVVRQAADGDYLATDLVKRSDREEE